jgi:chorismate mutase
MGRATIVEHLGEAKYKIQVHRDSPRVRAVIDKWVAEADSIDAQCVELEAEGSELEAAAAEAKADYEQAQVASEDQAEVNRLLGEYLSALAEWEAVANKLFGLQAHARHLRNKASNMEAELAPREDEAWCSTYTTNLAPGTEVATIEVARQGDDYPYHVIAPRGREPDSDDGQMRSVMSMTPAQTFLNYALWPGAVRWQRRYSSGIVTRKDDGSNTVEVILDTNYLGGIDVQPPNVYPHDVSSTVCTQNELLPFRVGDKVLVDHDSETVVGWSENPRPCAVGLLNENLGYIWRDHFGDEIPIRCEYLEDDYYIRYYKNRGYRKLYLPEFGPGEYTWQIVDSPSRSQAYYRGGYLIHWDTQQSVGWWSHWRDKIPYWGGEECTTGRFETEDQPLSTMTVGFLQFPFDPNLFESMTGVQSQRPAPGTAYDGGIYTYYGDFEYPIDWTNQTIRAAKIHLPRNRAHYVVSEGDSGGIDWIVVPTQALVDACGTSRLQLFVAHNFSSDNQESLSLRFGVTDDLIETSAVSMTHDEYYDEYYW